MKSNFVRLSLCLSVLASFTALVGCGGDAELTITPTPRPTAGSPDTPLPSTSTPVAPSATPLRPTNTTAPATATPLNATATATETLTPPTVPSATTSPTEAASATATSTPTPTDVSSSATPTSTSAPSATSTSGASPTSTSAASPTSTTVAASATHTATFTPTPTGGAASPTATSTFTPTPTATPIIGGAVCGNGFLEPGENFFDPTRSFLVGDPDGTSCPQDAAIGACTATTTRAVFDVQFDRPVGTSPNTVTALIGYRSDRLGLPGTGLATTVRQRITFPPPAPFVFTPNDFDYALRVVVGRSSAIAEGRLLTVSFDTCQAAPAPTIDDLACTIEGCSGSGGSVAGCTCSISIP